MQDNEPINLTYGQVSDMVNRIEQIPPLTGSGAPTAQTPAFYTGQTYVDTDTNDVYVCKEIDDTTSPTTYTWGAAGSSYTAGEAIDITNDVISATNTGKAKVLTTDDYNYPTTGTKKRVALWLLDDGIYYVPSEIQTSASTMYAGPDAGLVLVSHDHRTSNGLVRIDTFDTNNAQYVYLDHEDGSPYNSSQYVLLSGTVQNNLISTSGTMPLAANQGRVLKGLIDSIAIRGAGAPTTSTVGTVGKLYEDTTNGKLYICTAVSGSTYTWEEVGAGGSGPTVVQTTGTSTTDVMSQNAVTSMVFADPSTKVKVQIGDSAVANGAGSIAVGNTSRGNGNYSLAIGNTCRAGGINSVAIGSGADASQKGQFDISTSFGGSTLGYNDTQYRLLTGLYDPQNAHDAATKGYVDGLVGNIASALNAINNGGNN